ncbi:MAG: O-antigen ligase family protein [Chloroflexia bacterium]
MSTTTRTIEGARPLLGAEAAPAKEANPFTGRGVALDKTAATLILLLVLAVATNRLGLRVGGFNLRLEFIVGGILSAIALFRQRATALRTLGPVDLCLGGWLAINLISSLLFSPDVRESLKYVAILVGLLTIYAAARLLVRPGASLEWAAVAVVGAGAMVALLGLGCAILFGMMGPNFGVLLERFYRDGVFVVTPKVQSVLWEPNIYGSFSLAVCALASALVLARLRAGSKPDFTSSIIHRLPLAGLYLAAALGMCGVMLSMTRTVWLIGPPLVLLIAAVAWKLRLAGPRAIALSVLVPALVGGLVGLGVGMSLPAPQWRMGEPWELTPAQIDDMVRQSMFGTPAGPTANPETGGGNTAATTPSPVPIGQGSATGDRLGEVLGDPGQAPSLAGRWRVFTDAFEGWLRRPILGWGAGAFPLVYPPPPQGGYWIANIELHALFDTGIVGLALLAVAVVIAGRRAFNAIRYPSALWDAQAFVTFGLLCAGLGLLAAFQVTDGSWLGFTWLLLAMLMAGGRVIPDT